MKHNTYVPVFNFTNRFICVILFKNQSIDYCSFYFFICYAPLIFTDINYKLLLLPVKVLPSLLSYFKPVSNRSP